MENNITLDQAFSSFTIEQWQNLKVQFPGNASIATLVDSNIARIKIEADKAKTKAEFDAKLLKIAKALEPLWGDLKNILITKEDVMDLTKPEVVKLADGKEETRYPTVNTIKVRTNIYWSETQQVPKPASGKAGGKGSGKREVVIKFEDGVNAPLLYGTFASGQAFADSFNATHPKDKFPNDYIDVEREGGGNALRAAAKHSYFGYNPDGTRKS